MKESESVIHLEKESESLIYLGKESESKTADYKPCCPLSQVLHKEKCVKDIHALESLSKWLSASL